MSNQPKVSVIIPVYNTEKYLRQCLDSVVNQTLKEIEVICVDDGSTDSSLKILREYEAKDNRVIILQQKNAGGGAARNTGLAAAKGEYLSFLDSDDFFDLTTLEKAYAAAKQYEADVTLYDAKGYNQKDGKYFPMPWVLRKEMIPQQPFSHEDLPYTFFQMTNLAPWNKLFRHTFIREQNLKFQALPNTNDAYFVLSALALAKRISYVEDVLVCYRTNTGISTQNKKRAAPCAWAEAMKAIGETLKERGIYEALRDSYLQMVKDNCIFNFKTIDEGSLDYKARMEIVRELDLLPASVDFNAKPQEMAKKENSESKTKNDPEISVLIPVFNVEKYLRPCLDSVVNQTLKEIEIICVNDGSTDGSLAILEEYAQKDHRISIINKESNRGLLLARKSAVLSAKAKYVTFLDSDDVLTVDACQVMVDAAEKLSADVVQFGINVINHTGVADEARWLQDHLQPTNGRLRDRQISDSFFIKRNNTTSLLGKIFLRDLCLDVYTHIQDDYCYVGEDIYTAFYLSLFAKSWYGQPQNSVYIYNYGLGVSNRKSMPLNKFNEYCRMGKWAEAAQNFLCSHGAWDEFKTDWEAMAVRMMEDCCRIFKNQVAKEDSACSAKLIWKYWHNCPVFETVLERKFNMSSGDFVEKYNENLRIYVHVAPLYEACKEVPKVSVIIPIYNVEEYLRECLDSVVNQTMKDIEIICVNDGSWDDSLSIAEEYAAKDQRVTVISQKNGGLSAARNSGMKYAHGEYIYFIDSDDYIDLETLEELYDRAKENKLDALSFYCAPFYDDPALENVLRYSYKIKAYTDVYAGAELRKHMREEKTHYTSACMTLFRREFLSENGIVFKEGIIHEDELFCFLVYMQAQRMSCVGDQYYHRRIHSGSIMTRPKSAKNVMGYFTCLVGMLQYGLEHDLNEIQAEEWQQAVNSMQWATKNMLSKISQDEREKICFENPAMQIIFDKWFGGNGCNGLNAASGKGGSRNKISGAIRCCKDHGFWYTVRLVFHKIGCKLRSGIQCCRDHGFWYTCCYSVKKLRGKNQ